MRRVVRVSVALSTSRSVLLSVKKKGRVILESSSASLPPFLEIFTEYIFSLPRAPSISRTTAVSSSVLSMSPSGANFTKNEDTS